MRNKMGIENDILIEKFYPERKFGGFTDVDGTITFYNRINALIKPTDNILDIGCGRGEFEQDRNLYRKNLRIIKGKVAKVIGIDVDRVSNNNPYIDQFIQIQMNTSWQLPDNCIDLAFSDQVLEHVNNPALFFSECRRIIKPDGYLCIRTTNKMGYIALGSTLIPQKLHKPLLKRLQADRSEIDIFPTLFKCNTIFEIKRKLKEFGFCGIVYGFNSEPCYFYGSGFIFYCMKLFHTISPSYFKTTLFVFAKNSHTIG